MHARYYALRACFRSLFLFIMLFYILHYTFYRLVFKMIVFVFLICLVQFKRPALITFRRATLRCVKLAAMRVYVSFKQAVHVCTAYQFTALCSAIQKIDSLHALPDTMLENIERSCFLFLTIWQLYFNVSTILN